MNSWTIEAQNCPTTHQNQFFIIFWFYFWFYGNIVLPLNEILEINYL